MLDEGYFHSLGHGVGLEVHEQPSLGRVGEGLGGRAKCPRSSRASTRRASAAVRLEDLVRVTAEGCERLTDYPYDLSP